MPWGGQTWCRATKEVDYGVRNPSPNPSDILYFRLIGDNSFTMRAAPQRQIIRSADAGNRKRQVVAARKAFTGSMSTACYPSQAEFLFGLATLLTGSDLSSVTLDYFDSTRIQSYLGAKLQTIGLTSSATQDYLTMNMGWIAQRNDATFTVFPQPADSVFPTEVPYEHVESAGLVTVGGATLTKYSACNFSLSNVLGPTWDELPYISNLYYCGRDVTFTITPQYVSDTFRTEFEAQSPLTCILEWARSSPVSSITMNCETANYIGSISDSIPLGGPAYQTIGVEAFLDPSNSTDMAITVVSPP